MRLLLVALWLGLVSSLSYSESFVIDAVNVEGLQRVSAGTVFERLSLEEGDVVDSSQLADAARRIFLLGLFDDIQIYREGQSLIVRLVELPTIASIDLEGVDGGLKDALLENLRQSGLSEGQVFKRAIEDRITQEIQRQYVSQGQYNAEVDTQIQALPRNRVALKIKIEDGDPATIAHINIVGNKVFTEQELLSQFSLQATNFWSWYASDNKYSREKLIADQETLRSYYYDRGYIRFNIEDTQVSLSPEKDSVYITISVSEGSQYRIGEIRMAGNLLKDESLYRELFQIQSGDVFSRRLVNSSSQAMSRLLSNDGYTFAKVDGSPRPDDENLTVGLTYFVEPGRRTYVRSINFSGNDNTRDEVLRREMVQIEGGWASTDDIESGRNRLNQLGFFKSVVVQTPAVPGTDDLIDVNYAVEEQLSGSLNFNVGYAGGSGMIIGASISQNNFLGSGNQISLGIQKNRTVQSYNFSFKDPYYTVHGVSRGFNVFYRETDYERLSSVSDYQTNTRGGNLTFGYPVTLQQRVSISLGYSHTDMFEGSTVPAEITEFIDSKGDSFDEYTFGLNWRYNTLNRGLFPTKGMSHHLYIDLDVPGSTLTSYKTGYTANFYMPIVDEWSVRLKTELGYGVGYGNEERLPFYKNFRSGGLGSVRGYTSNSLGPRGLPEYTAVSVVQTDENGNVLYEMDELGMPIVDSNSPSIVYKTDSYGAATAVSNASRYKPIYETDAQGSVVTAPYYAERPTAIGGNLLTEASIELIFPFPFIEDRSSVRSVAFVDMGNVFTDQCYSPSDSDVPNLTSHPYCESGFDAGELRLGTGIGVTWITGVGPLTFVYSIPINPQDDDRTEGFEFSLGQAF